MNPLAATNEHNISTEETHQLHESILRAYDIRGVVGETIFETDAYAIGRAFTTIIQRETGKENPIIATARDGRKSSPALSEQLKRGMKDAGAIVYDIGIGPTPMLYFATHYFGADGSIMLTGSHNPPTHNGFKMTRGTKPFYGDDILEIGRVAAMGATWSGNNKKEGGRIEYNSVFDAYVSRILEAFNNENTTRDLTIIWDAGNGAAGEVMKAITAKLPGKHILLFEDIDSDFPNHHPDPTVPENLTDLQKAVKEHKADFGVAFDGDGDRIGAVDSRGRIIWGDQLLMLFAREVLSRKKGAKVIADVKASQTLFDDVEKHGGQPIMWKTGHSLIKAKMAEEKAEIAGEMSGHIFFADGYYGFDDGLYAAIRLADIAAHSKQTITEMVDTIPESFSTPEIRIACEDSRKFEIIEEIRRRALEKANNERDSYEVNEVDGVRVKIAGETLSGEHGWWLARASNTQAAVIVRCEASSAEALQQLKTIVKEQLLSSGIQTRELN